MKRETNKGGKTSVTKVTPQAMGQPLRRKEDARLITGQTRWTDNLELPGLLHMAIVRSPMAHARITRVDVSAALGSPGVVAAFTGRDLASDYDPLPTVWTVSDDLIVPDHLPLATDEVRYLGDAVAVVVADGQYQAADAGEAVDVEYDPLPAVVDWTQRSPTARRWCMPTGAPTAPSAGASPLATTRRRGLAPTS